MSDSNDWLLYLAKQLQNNQESSSTKLLGFSWASTLSKFVEEYEANFNVHKYRSAVFYLNYSARQMRGMSGDVGYLLMRKITKV